MRKQGKLEKIFQPKKYTDLKKNIFIFSEEILKVEQKYNKQRRPLFASRQAAIEKLDKK